MSVTELKKNLLKLFILVFFMNLVAPNFNLFNEAENEKTIKKENRNISPFPVINILSPKFYSDFENWYQDRLWFREEIISWWKKYNFKFGIMLDDGLVIGGHNWIFSKVVKPKFIDSDKKIKSIKHIQELCEKERKHFVFMLAPSKEVIYYDWLPKVVKRSNRNIKQWDAAVKQKTDEYNVNYVTCYNAMMNEKKRSKYPLYFEDDHHWSYDGAAVAADLLLKKMNVKDYKGLQFDGSRKNSIKAYSYRRRLGLGINEKTHAPWSKAYTNSLYTVNQLTGKRERWNGLLSQSQQYQDSVKGELIIYNEKANNNVRMLILGDSYSGYMTPYISQFVQLLVVTHYNKCVLPKKNVSLKALFNKYNPDIVVFEAFGSDFIRFDDSKVTQNILLK